MPTKRDPMAGSLMRMRADDPRRRGNKPKPGRELKPAGPWKPSLAMRGLLQFAVQWPGDSRAQLAARAGVSDTTVYRWMALPEFRRWWDAELTEAMAQLRGDMVRELVALVGDPATPRETKVRAITAYMEETKGAAAGKEASMLVLLQAFQASGPGSELRMASGTGPDGRPALAASIRRPDPEVLDVERQGQELGALRASASPERVAARVLEVLAQHSVPGTTAPGDPPQDEPPGDPVPQEDDEDDPEADYGEVAST